MKTHKIAHNLFLVQLDQKLVGFTNFIGAWLYKGNNSSFLIDPGPAATVPALLKALEELAVDRLDCILLTHIHIDHAGGIGDLIEKFPDTPVVCHQSGIKHLVDPARLWEGSQKTLGDKAIAYGPIKPVPKGLLREAAKFTEYGLHPIITPGHASHHVSYLHGPYLFVGEAGGVYTDLGADGYFLRPATPPRFIYETSIESLNRLLALTHKTVCYGHFGATENTPALLKAHKKQLEIWLEAISSIMTDRPEAELLDIAFTKLLSIDPHLKTWEKLSRAIQEREKGFMTTSIRGFIGYLQKEQEGS